jgi:hypothetical protein
MPEEFDLSWYEFSSPGYRASCKEDCDLYLLLDTPGNIWDKLSYYTLPHFYHLQPEVCTGEGACHGCLKWCDYCGNVDAVCDVQWPHWCDIHQRYPEKPDMLDVRGNPNQLSFTFLYSCHG